ncbi:putative short-chain dehydrogenase [Talaromyces proteolyticus]|uniref:Short-chain dehydrogenase n=1 Tax=Talaromyces proteolyticus TaxID=1131652 RepID=A0AAD4KHM8_9EURO|nr:putative short-chain dehydrogenase [Talaromyces proteolyticus]KAH8691980.1 putative short-chain dehydrogenase [Talaromyces proteolyticus]
MSSRFQRSVLITGGTAGLGYHCALNVARKHPEYQIVIASRFDSNASAATANKLLGHENVKFLRLDLSSLGNVRSFAQDWEESKFPLIRALVLNAALQLPGDVQYTEDGYEKTFAISHLGHALLLCLLQPHLADTARVVIVSSGTHDPAQKSGMPDAKYHSAEELAHPTADSAKNAGRQRYTSTKLANVLYTYSLHRRFASINEKTTKHWTVNAFDPGLMPGTGLARDANLFERFLWHRILPKALPLLRLMLSPNIHSPEDSGEALAWLTIGPELESKSGLYYEGKAQIKTSKASYDRIKQEDLWEWTVSTLARNEEERKAFCFSDVL